VVIRMQKEFNNIFLIDQENQGVSRARNKGIDNACGQYLLFIDPDDYVEANSFSKIFKNNAGHLAQVTFLGFTLLDELYSVRRQLLYKEESGQLYPGTEAYFLARGDGFSDPDRIWGVLFLRDFLNKNNLRYLPDVPYLEDGEFIARILCLAERCFFIGCSFYWRTTRPGSATNSSLFNSVKAVKGFITAAANLRSFRDNTQLSIIQKEFMNQPVVKYVVLSISSTSKISRLKMFIKVHYLLKENNLSILNLNGCNKMYKKLGTLYNISALLLYSYLILMPLIEFSSNLLHNITKGKVKL
jgi:glycosyltransferase involved in cell wall biosynthesis